MNDGAMDFGDALRSIRAGKRVQRAGWNGKGMWLALVSHWAYGLGPILAPHTDGLRHGPFVAMKTADGCFVPWLASQTDILATDWREL